MPKFTIISTTADSGIFASSTDGEGIHAESNSSVFAAIAAIQLNTNAGAHPAAIYGESHGEGAAIYGESRGEGAAIAGFQKHPTSAGNGIYGETVGDGDAIAGVQRNPTSQKAGIYGEHVAGLTAGFFRGNVIVTGDLSFPGADCSEHFAVDDDPLVEPGTVMALSATGSLVPTVAPYEKKVVGVVAGAGSYRPGIIMDKQESTDLLRQPIALVGKAFCKVDASYGAIEIGDLLTSSATHGHAMHASDPTRAFGSVIGKAMAPLSAGLGLIPILIALQ